MYRRKHSIDTVTFISEMFEKSLFQAKCSNNMFFLTAPESEHSHFISFDNSFHISSVLGVRI